MKEFDTVIVGAGLAGLTCGLELSGKGKKVLLLEAEPVVGGRTANYSLGGMEVESGFHRYIGYYTTMPKVLRKAGIRLNEIFTWEEKIEIRVKHDDKLVTLGLAPLFGPLKLISGVLGNNKLLSLRDKLSLVPFFLNGFKDYALKPKELDKMSIREYAAKYGVREDAFHNVVVPLSTGIYFLPPERYSAYVFFGLLAPGIPRLFKLRIGAYLGGMTDVMCRPMADVIEKRCGTVMTKQKVVKLLLNEQQEVIGVETHSGEKFYGKHVVVATTLNSAKQLLNVPFGKHAWFQPMLKLPMMPAAVFQIDLKKPALRKDITTFGPRTSMASFAEQSRTTFRGRPGRLSIILADPEKFLPLTPEETLEIVLRDAEALGMHIREDVLDYRKIDHNYDFHSLEPGYNWMRPDQNTPVKGLVLAGDYTMQPIFATMEGACISGVNAAKIILKRKNPIRRKSQEGYI
ncbi:NAD(P)/FAD-dependent oxidoreductase [Ectobacillus ponti]|uniref:FAD-dependent oxidoreductase n=1 Tax=Ectobacillus ponti TaxID=2961894 RepID=A0AA41X4G9_9BACI|nr:NAD(P)/FAD-dependent oxidoreductase [Ectobacillus ponti]MCP8968567.1 FAD-dependent oxidoreductase [Ectobacillus ponti]